MDGTGREPGSGRRLGLLLLALAGWVAIIVVAAGRRPEDPPLVGVENLDNVFLVLVLLTALFGLVLLIVLNPFQREWTKPERRVGPYGAVAFLLAGVALLVWNPTILDEFVQPDEQEDNEDPELLELDNVARPAEPETVAEATDILALAVVVGGIVGAVLFLRRRTAPPPEVGHHGPFEAELAQAMERAETALTDDGDPRTAVLNAYRSLERVFERRGTPRAPSETPAEHVARSLDGLPIDSSAVARLAKLYEVARFSDRMISPTQRDQARDALRQARADLATAMPADRTDAPTQ